MQGHAYEIFDLLESLFSIDLSPDSESNEDVIDERRRDPENTRTRLCIASLMSQLREWTLVQTKRGGPTKPEAKEVTINMCSQ